VRMTIVTIVVEILYGDSKIIVLFHTWILTYQYQVVAHPGAHVCRYLCQYSSTRIVEHVRARLRYHPLRIRGFEIRLLLDVVLLSTTSRVLEVLEYMRSLLFNLGRQWYY
jgi:hypothetical protein